jgi:hypothetical protein
MDNGYKPAPPVLEFDEKGNYIQGWRGPSKTGEYQRTNRGGLHSSYAECASGSEQRRTNGDGRPGSGEHGITVDYKRQRLVDRQWDGDGQVLKFTRDRKFLLQIGHLGMKANSNDTANVSRATTIVVYQKTNEVFVADGYGNRRVVVFDADTGKYKRHWGAYGNKPDDSVPNKRLIAGPGAQQFNTVHGIAISDDDLVYGANRGNNGSRCSSLRHVHEGSVCWAEGQCWYRLSIRGRALTRSPATVPLRRGRFGRPHRDPGSEHTRDNRTDRASWTQSR